tara:strand:- start:2073 stop:3077 length:1005 start_codon:yes stop_codon:yes gene_type:complete
MRFYEFKQTFKTNPMLEYDPKSTDRQLKDLIIQRLATEDDRDMLDKIYQALNKSTLDERISAVLATDDDAKGKLKVFSGIVMNTEGTFEEKNNFVEKYSSGFIDTDKLRSPNQVHSYSEWIMGDDFVKRVFNELYKYTPQGIGAGEFALAVLSPNIKFSGRSAEMAGDLVIDGVMCEVKAKEVAGGRFFDGRKAKMDQRAVEAKFKSLGIEVGKGISGKMFVAHRPNIEQNELPSLVDTIIKGAFAFIEDGESQQLKSALTNGDSNVIKHAWGLLSFTNYQRMSKFQSMLLLDGPKAHSLYFTEIDSVSSILRAGQPYVCGPDQQVHPQMTFAI